MTADLHETRQAQRLIARLNAVPPLDREQERALCRRYLEQGDRAAGERVVSASMRHVIPLALRYRHYGVALSELLAQGCVALAGALDRFDPERGVRFATYASHWARAELLTFLLRNRTLVGGGRGPLRPRYVFKLRREHRRLVAELGEGEAAVARLAERFGKSASDVQDILVRIDSRDASLDARSADGERRGTLLDTLSREDVEAPEETIARNAKRARMQPALESALRALNPRERFIVEQRITADEEERLSLVDLGKRFGVSRERARQLESNALLKLRKRLMESGEAIFLAA